MKIESGKLDRKLQLMSVTTTRDAMGQAQETSTLVATIWAQRLEMRTVDIARIAGREAVGAGRYLIRYRANIAVGMKVITDGITYKITSVEPQDRRASIVIGVEESA